MSSLLNTKLYRDLWVSKWQFIAVCFVVVLGISMFVAGLVSYHNLFESYHASYDRLHFADFWILFDQAPEDTVRQIARLPGIRLMEGRVNVEYPLLTGGRTDTSVVGRFIGLPTRHRPAVNNVRVVAGRYFKAQAKHEALLEVGFARAHKIVPGDVVTADVEGTNEDFRVVGLAQSPEYIIAVRNKQYGMPTPSTFGVVFLPEEQAQESFNLEGKVTEICVIVGSPKAKIQNLKSEMVRSLVDRAHAMLKPYGAGDSVVQKDQASNEALTMDLESIHQLATIFPSLFLAAAAMTIYVLMTRIVLSQRPHIGFLRASGFTQRVIAQHYLSYSLAVGLVGGITGSVAGYYMGYLITAEYVRILNIPYLATRMRWDAVMTGLMFSLLTCFAAGIIPAWAAGTLPPAVAMRDEVPMATRRVVVDWMLRTFASLPYLVKVPLRNLVRSRRRTLSTAMGIASGLSLVMVSAMFLDAIDYSISTYFGKMQKYDALVELLPEHSGDMVYHVAQHPGVQRAEAGFSIPVELEKEGKKFSTVLLGLPATGRLYRVLDERGRPTHLLDDSLRVGNLVRKKLGLETGDDVVVRYAFDSEDAPAAGTLRVGPVIEQPATTLVYANIETVRRLFGSALNLAARPLTGIAIQADPRYMNSLRTYLHDLPQAAAVEITADTRAELADKMKFTYTFISIMLFFGVGLAFAIVFNTLSINVMERTREIASLMTLGFRHSQIALMMTFENLMVSVLGLALGYPLGLLLCHWLIKTYQSETVDLQVILYPRTYFLTGIGMVLVVVFAQIPSLRSVKSLDLAKATKERAG